MKLLTAFAVVFLCLTSPVFGQTTFGSITGTVTDPTGAVIPGAAVSVTNAGTGIERKVTTSAGGVFNVPNLDIGAYRVTVNASGFARYERSGLVLSSNQILNVDARLELATTATVTEVRGAMSVEGSADARRVALERIPAQAMGRALHVGPYAEEPRSFAKIEAALAAAGRTPGFPHLEVYLSDPRRTKPAKLRTVVLLETA